MGLTSVLVYLCYIFAKLDACTDRLYVNKTCALLTTY